MFVKQPEADRKKYYSPAVGLTRSNNWRSSRRRCSSNGEEWSREHRACVRLGVDYLRTCVSSLVF